MNWSMMPSRSPINLQRDTRAARGGFPSAEEQKLFVSSPGIAAIASARTAAVACASVNPPMGPSIGTSSKPTFCATVIITCCSLALGPSETSQTLLPGFFAARLRGFIQRAGCPGVENSGQKHFIFQAGPAGAGDGLKCLQRIRDDARADDDV